MTSFLFMLPLKSAMVQPKTMIKLAIMKKWPVYNTSASAIILPPYFLRKKIQSLTK